MPIFKLPPSNIDITQRLAAIMLYPNDVAMRKRLQKAFLIDVSNFLVGEGLAQITDAQLHKEHQKDHVRYADMINQAIMEGKDGPSLVGAQLLATLGNDPKIASLNFSRDVLERAYKNRKATSKRRQIDLWNKYESVAHFWAAHQIWMDPGAIVNLNVLEGFPRHPSQVRFFLAIAEYYRRKGENFKSLRTPNESHLLDKNRTWRVSPALRSSHLPDEDFRFDSKSKFFEPVLKERKK